jgi:hypothetical protein
LGEDAHIRSQFIQIVNRNVIPAVALRREGFDGSQFIQIVNRNVTA